jgi:electron transport complex protein RnfC
LKTFPSGGIHPPEYKLTASKLITQLPVPENVVISVAQHIGLPASPVVAKGDIVKVGQLIAAGNGFVSANVHTSVSGKVHKIDTVLDASGFKQPAIFIDTDGDEWIDTIDQSTVIERKIKLSPPEIVKRCFEAGVVGLGGATFPTHVKLTIPSGKKCDLLIINGVECEPFLTSDHRLMVEKGEEVLTGITIIMNALGVEKAVIGIENNKPDAISNLTVLAASFEGITIEPLKVKYPQGAEKQLIKALSDREVPSGRLPVDVGVIVHNVGTAFAVYEAVQKNKPLFERIVTVTGRSLLNPGNFLARTGTSVKNLIEAAGGMPEETGKIISGGPMMGKAIHDINVPVVKGMSGIVVFPETESARGMIIPCIRCARCVAACPMNLEPYLLMVLAEKGLFEKAEKENITDCMECGSCSFICPSVRPLLDYIRLGKSTVIKMAREKILK